MKIVTYNLNGIRARLPRLVEYLEEQKPDALCLQEIKCADEVEADDLVAGEGGVTLVVDPMTHDLVKGGAVDYVESLGGAAFQVTNPNAASGCGCGSSFSV